MTPLLKPAALVDPMVEAKAVWKSFGTQVALRGVDWTVPRGQISGLLGPNGAGKTTLFRLLMGILKPTEGSLTIEGLDCFEDRVLLKRRVGFLPDEPVFYNYLTGHEMLQLSLGMHGLDPSALARLAPWIHRLGLSDSMHRHAEEYSRGMKKKLGLLMALLHRPSLLILDEPTNGLDVESTHQFFEMMRELADDGTAILFSTHLLDQVEHLCSHAAVIHTGRIVASGDLDAIRGGRGLVEAFLELTATKRP